MESKKKSFEEMGNIEGGMSCGWALALAGGTSVVSLLACAGVLSCLAGLLATAYSYDQAYTACGVSPWGG